MDNTGVSMRAVGDGKYACWRPQRLPGKSEGPKGGTTSDRPCRTWTDGSSTTLLTKTEVLVGGELDVENVEIGENYLGTGKPHIRENTTRILHGIHKGTKNAY